MRISEFKNEEALDLLIDIIDPISQLFTDEEFVRVARSGSQMQAIKVALKNHKKEVIEVLAILNRTPVEKYECNLISITKDLLELFNDKELKDFFTYQELMEEGSASSEPTDNTKAKKKPSTS